MRKNILFLLLLIPGAVGAQTVQEPWGLGASGIYNFQTKSIGAGLRASFRPNEDFSYVPQVSYFFPFNKVHELHVGMAVEYKVYRHEYFDIYPLVHAGYNYWANYNQSGMEGAQPHNWNLEGGIGIEGTGQWRPFAEYRYNVRFRETHLSVGILYIFNQPKKRGAVKCPTPHNIKGKEFYKSKT